MTLIASLVATSSAPCKKWRHCETSSLRSSAIDPASNTYNFTKDLGSGRQAKIDLLAALPDDRTGLKLNPPRVRPQGATNIHAYPTPEAATLTFRPRRLSMIGREVLIPASINYLILKMHAFRDRLEDHAADLGRHHAFDIFRIVTDMDREDWEIAEAFGDEHGDDSHVREARRIREQLFDTAKSLGVIRLRENVGFTLPFETYLENFIADLRELLPPAEQP